MKHLNRLTPAETYFVLKDDDASQKNLLKMTLVDLILKKVLRPFEVIIEYNQNDVDTPKTYVAIAENFWTYKPVEHELIFLSPFISNNSIQILFSNMVKIGYQNSKSEKKLYHAIRKSRNLDRCYQQNFYQLIFGGYSLT